MRWLDGITNSMDMEFEQTLGDGERQGSLACCSPWGHKESDTTEQLRDNIIVISRHMWLVATFLGQHTPQAFNS